MSEQNKQLLEKVHKFLNIRIFFVLFQIVPLNIHIQSFDIFNLVYYMLKWWAEGAVWTDQTRHESDPQYPP